MNTIIGYSGFIGLNLCNQIEFINKFNSKNINEINSIIHDVVYCCGISGNKFVANNNPNEDKKKIDSLIHQLKTLKCNKFLLISTIDIYFDTVYGKNRKYAEQELNKIFGDKLYIIRLPALFGDYLKKNIMFDLINNKFFGKVNLENKLQWYYISNLSKDISYLFKNNICKLNLFTEPIILKEIVDKFFIYNDMMYYDINNAIVYDFKTKHTKSGYWKNKNDVIKDLKRWLKKY